jgi:pimeloyl-ACP methyl ester carboxylesterase
LNPERKLVIAGHSLGGATATLIADLLWESGNKNIALVTAGAPRPGGRALRKRLEGLEILRFVHGNDIVPSTPPYIFGYVHPHSKIQLKDIEDTRLDGVTDHNIGDYVKAAEKHFAAKKVVL